MPTPVLNIAYKAPSINLRKPHQIMGANFQVRSGPVGELAGYLPPSQPKQPSPPKPLPNTRHAPRMPYKTGLPTYPPRPTTPTQIIKKGGSYKKSKKSKKVNRKK